MTATLAHGIESLKQRAAQQFARLGFPTTRNEDWKFTSVAPIAHGVWQPPVSGSETSVRPEELQPFQLGLPTHELVFINGQLHASLSRLGDLPSGLTVLSLEEALALYPDRVQSYLGSVADDEHHGFTALNTSQFRDGAVIIVAPGLRVDAPVHLLFLATTAESTVMHPRNLVLAGESSQISVVESYGSLGEFNYFTNAVTEIVVGANARVEHIKLQRESELAFHIGTTEVKQERDSRFRSFSFALGSALSRTNIYSIMAGEGSDCTMNGLYMLRGNQHIDHQTRIEHAYPNCTSREIYKGVLDGTSHAVFNGKVYVRPEAQKTDGKQTNKNLLLSDGAKVDTKPQLEIFADDVKCTHGATVGRLDEIGLFYLQSRGISAARARRLLTYGFAADVLAEIDEEAIRHQLDRLVFERLETSLG